MTREEFFAKIAIAIKDPLEIMQIAMDKRFPLEQHRTKLEIASRWLTTAYSLLKSMDTSKEFLVDLDPLRRAERDLFLALELPGKLRELFYDAYDDLKYLAGRVCPTGDRQSDKIGGER